MKIDSNITSLLSKSAAKPTLEQEVTEQSSKWVAQTFYGTLLKQLRNSPFKSELFSGGRGAQAFGPLMDQQMVDHLARTTGKKLVASLAKSMMKKANKSAGQINGGTNVSTTA